MTTIQGKSRSAGRTARGLCIEENWISHLMCASAEIQTEANLKKKKKIGKGFYAIMCQRKKYTQCGSYFLSQRSWVGAGSISITAITWAVNCNKCKDKIKCKGKTQKSSNNITTILFKKIKKYRDGGEFQAVKTKGQVLLEFRFLIPWFQWGLGIEVLILTMRARALIKRSERHQQGPWGTALFQFIHHRLVSSIYRKGCPRRLKTYLLDL